MSLTDYWEMGNRMYLTEDLIVLIQRQALDPIWKIVTWKTPNNWFDIVTVSPLNLIHFYGNSDTGWQHIQERHQYFSDKNYFGKGALGNPSKLKKGSIPINDYVNIADDVFYQGIKDTKPHPDNNLFDKYKGESVRYTDSQGIAKEFFLVLYKSTKIVHSIFPVKNLEGKSKRILVDFARCKDQIVLKKKPIDDYFTITIPYENCDKIIRYVFVIRMHEFTQICKIFLQVNDFNGLPWYTMYPELAKFKANFVLSPPILNIDLEFTRFLNGLGYTNFTELEKVIQIVEDYLQTQLKKID